MYPPSILAHMLNAFFLLVSLFFVMIYFSKLQGLDAYRILVLILLFSLVVGVHGISHLGLEREYGFFAPTRNPMNGHMCPCMKMGHMCPFMKMGHM